MLAMAENNQEWRDQNYFVADQAAQQVTGIHLVFHGLVLAAIAVLASRATGLAQLVPVSVAVVVGLVIAGVTVLRDIRMEAFREFWAGGHSRWDDNKHGWIDYRFDPGNRYDQVSKWINWRLRERSRPGEPSRWLYSASRWWLVRHSRRTIALGLVPLYLTVFVYMVLTVFATDGVRDSLTGF